MLLPSPAGTSLGAHLGQTGIVTGELFAIYLVAAACLPVAGFIWALDTPSSPCLQYTPLLQRWLLELHLKASLLYRYDAHSCC